MSVTIGQWFAMNVDTLAFVSVVVALCLISIVKNTLFFYEEWKESK